eukprot:13222211-Alexandrium_andersonii.AAC.1
MSASLVGSEMCIRDRVEVEKAALRRGNDRVGHGEAAPKSTRSMQDAAVSYTHLTLPTICSV